MIINRSRKRKRRKEGRKKIRRQPVSFLRKLSVFIGTKVREEETASLKNHGS